MTRKFAIRLLLFLVLALAVNFLLDRAFKAFSVHNSVNRMMDEQFAAYDDTLKYLAMGNSHNCVNTYILPNSFNYGSPSENYIQSYYKLKHILEKSGKKPEYLLLQADISCFGPKIARRYEYNSYWIKYIDYIELAKVMKTKNVAFKWFEGRFLSYAGNYKDIQLSILYRIKFRKLEMYHGYRPHRDYRNFANEKDRKRVAWNKANLVLSKQGYFDPTIRVYFDKILQICQEHGVKVILLRFPETKEFFEEEIRMVPVGRLYSEIDSIASKYAVYQGIINYQDMFFEHPEYFFDPDHVNVEGTDIFTKKLAEDLEKL